MNNIFAMLNVSSWKGLIDSHPEITWTGEWLGKLLDVLSQVLWVALAIVGTAGAIYAIYVGVKMARADSADAREENKKRLVNIIVSIVVVIVLIIVFNIFVPMILDAVWTAANNSTTPSEGGSGAVRLLTTFLR